MGYSASVPASAKENMEGFRTHKIAKYLSSLKPSTRRRDLIRRITVGILFLMLVIGTAHHYSNVTSEIDVRTSFTYPLDIPNFRSVIQQFRYSSSGSKWQPINNKYVDVPILKTTTDKPGNGKTPTPVGLLIVVKSAILNYDKRESIRKTWGSLSYLNDTTLSPSHPTKLAFICGVPEGRSIENPVDIFPNEMQYNDIIIADFADNYSNNSYKSILALRWAVEEYGSNFQYLLLVDDDMYIDLFNLQFYLKNLPNLKFIRHYDKQSGFSYYQLSTIYKSKNHSLVTSQEILDDGLYMGRIYAKSEPIRPSLYHYLKGSVEQKWSVSLEEYPFNYYAPYNAGAAILFSREAVHKMFYSSLFVKHFWIDDVFLGIIAYKMGIIPVHNPHFHPGYNNGAAITSTDTLSETIALHGCQCPAQMIELWMNRNPDKMLKCTKPRK